MKLGSNDISLALGGNVVPQAYLGSQLVYSSQPVQPYDAEVEYIQTDGTQWIDTGIVPTVSNETEITMVLARISGNTSSEGFGSNSNLNMVLSGDPNKWRFSGVQTNIAIVNDTYVTITLKQTSQGRFYNIDGVSGYGSSNAANNHFLIGALGGSPAFKFWAKWKSIVVKENDEVILDLIPVRKETTGYMYDSVSGLLLGNSGTGDFIFGPDVV